MRAHWSSTTLKLAALCAALRQASAFYIPGYSVKTYEDGQPIPLYVNKVYSDNTQLQYAYYDLPFVCPPSGRQHGGQSSGSGVSLNLGEVLRGDRIMTSDFDLVMGQDEECRYLCTQTIDRAGVKRARKLIEDGYVADWILDNLPGATRFVTVDRKDKYYAAGFKIGTKDFSHSTGKPQYFLYNHYTIVVRWREASGKAGRNGGKVIVGFEVYTHSIAPADRNSTGCPSDMRNLKSLQGEGMNLYIPPNNTIAASTFRYSSYLPEEDSVDDGATLSIPFSYSVYFREDPSIEWSSRWDMYFKNQEESSRIHWLAIANSLVISGLLTAIVVMIWNRIVYGDGKLRDGVSPLEEGKVRLSSKRAKKKAVAGAVVAAVGTGASGTKSPRLSEKSPSGAGVGGGGGGGGLLDSPDNEDSTGGVLSSDDESLAADDITGWKLLHADVFRTPQYAGLLAPLIGSGSQLAFMTVGLLGLSCVGILNPSFRGGFVSVGMGLFVFAGLLSGYFSGRLYKTFGGVNFRKNTLMTALLVPGMLFSTVFVLNLFVWAQASSTALPFGTLLGLLALWLLIQVPLVWAGSWAGYKASRAWEHPTKTSAVPRQIPAPAWYAKRASGVLYAGLVCFAVLFIELLFVFRSLWQDKSGYYYAFGFLTVVSALEILTVVEATVVAVYLQLCAENYHWWWRSFFVGASNAAWVFLYSVWFFFAKLKIQGLVSTLLFFSYSLLACSVYGLMTGTVGFLTAYAFVRRIYGGIKAD